jgi:hypothetical protein
MMMGTQHKKTGHAWEDSVSIAIAAPNNAAFGSTYCVNAQKNTAKPTLFCITTTTTNPQPPTTLVIQQHLNQAANKQPQHGTNDINKQQTEPSNCAVHCCDASLCCHMREQAFSSSSSCPMRLQVGSKHNTVGHKTKQGSHTTAAGIQVQPLPHTSGCTSALAQHGTTHGVVAYHAYRW